MQSRLAEVFEQEFDDMVRLARVFLGNSPDVEDVVMAAFTTTAAQMHRLENPGGYLRTSVVNQCRRHLRDQSRRGRIWRERVAPLHPVSTLDEGDFVADMLSVLSERERTAIVLTYYLDYRHEDTATVLNCRPGTVKSLIHRALKKLRIEVES